MKTTTPKTLGWVLAAALCAAGCADTEEESGGEDTAEAEGALAGGEECRAAKISIADAHSINVDINASGYRRNESNVRGTLTRSGATYDVVTDDDIPIDGLVRRTLKRKNGGGVVTLRRGDSLRLTLVIDRPFINGLVGWTKNDKECEPVTLRY